MPLQSSSTTNIYALPLSVVMHALTARQFYDDAAICVSSLDEVSAEAW